LVIETQDIECIFGIFKFFIVINRRNTCLALRNVDVVVDIVADVAFFSQGLWTNTIPIGLEQLVEDMVSGSLDRCHPHKVGAAGRRYGKISRLLAAQ